MTDWVKDDGGRADAGFVGSTGDCVTRAIAIATELPYIQVYNALFEGERQYRARARNVRGKASPREGILRKVYDPYLEGLGWQWTPTIRIGEGCKIHLRADELPAGRLIVRVSKHLCAVVDGMIHDIHNPSRNGTRCVYGYWSKP